MTMSGRPVKFQKFSQRRRRAWRWRRRRCGGNVGVGEGVDVRKAAEPPSTATRFPSSLVALTRRRTQGLEPRARLSACNHSRQHRAQAGLRRGGEWRSVHVTPAAQTASTLNRAPKSPPDTSTRGARARMWTWKRRCRPFHRLACRLPSCIHSRQRSSATAGKAALRGMLVPVNSGHAT